MTMKTTHPDRKISRPVTAEAMGFGLVELMISIAIGLVILAALVTLFVNTSRNNREMATANSVIENGRFAIDLLENEVVHAGYWSTYVPDFDDPTMAPSVVPTSTPLAVPDPCAAFDAATWIEGSTVVNELIGIPVQVIPDGSAVCSAIIKNRVAGTDAIVIRHAGRCVPPVAPGVGSCPADDGIAPDLFIQASLCVDELDDGNLYVFGRNGEETFPLHRRNCTTLAEKRRFESYIYYVRDYAVTPGDDIPTLVRSEFRLEAGTLEFRAPVPMVEGVDGLWAELGIDDVSITGAAVDNSAALVWEDPDTKMRATNRGDSVPDEFVRCTTDPATCTAAQLTNVTAVQMYVLARSREATRGYTDTKAYAIGAAGNVPAFNDGFKRHVYSTTVRLHNIAGRRIRPGDEEAP
jgi:type IV pilus assembly protein PilW